MKRILLFTLAALLTGVPSLLAVEDPDNPRVPVSENDTTPHIVTFPTPTPTTATTLETSVKKSITITNASSKNADGSFKYNLDEVKLAPDSTSDSTSWKCVASSVTELKYKIAAIKSTPLAYDINGGLTEKVKDEKSPDTGTTKSGPKKTTFKVTVPAETVLTWNNSLSSHETTDDPKNPKAPEIRRVKIAASEQVYFRIANSHLGNPVWTAGGGCFNASNSSSYSTSLNHETEVTWTAPKNPGPCTVIATFPIGGTITAGEGGGAFSVNGAKATVTFDVILPSGASVKKLNENGTNSGYFDPNDKQGTAWVGVTMNLKYKAEPRDVNYAHMLVAEDNSPEAVEPKNPVYYFAKVKADTTSSRHHDLIHRPVKNWTYFDADGTYPDQALYPDAAALLDQVGNASWETGSFHWDIPVHFRGEDPRAPGFSRTPGEPTEKFRVKQEFTLTSSPSPATVGQGPIKVTLKCTKTGTTGDPAKVENTIEN